MTHPLRFLPASPYRLQLDIDSAADLQHFYRLLPWFSCILNEHHAPLRGHSLKRSRSGRRWHVEIYLSRPMKKIERIMLQAILGSDRARELCNYERVLCKSTHPILFIQKSK